MKELSLIKERARKVFKEYIRLRDALKTTGSPFSCICCTCGKEKEMNGQIHAGHFKAGSTNSVYFEETNVHGQCAYCNTYLHGALDKYQDFMVKTYGREEVYRLNALKGTTVKYTIQDYEEILKKYKEKIKNIYSSE